MSAGRTLQTKLGLLTASLMLVGACSGDDASADGADRGDATEEAPDLDEGRRQEEVDTLVETLVETPRADFRTDDEPRCVAEGLVDRLGSARLEELGLDIESGTGPTLFVPHLTEPERDEVDAAYDDCLDHEARDVEAFMSEGLTEEQALCVHRAYRASGIPRTHATEIPHSQDLNLEQERVRAAHALLDEFLTVTKEICQAWIIDGASPGDYRG